MAKLYNIDCSITKVQPEDGKKFSLKEAQSFVGGYVELVHLNGDNILLCDEEGLIKHKARNMMATIDAKLLGWKGDSLVGSVLFLKDNEF